MSSYSIDDPYKAHFSVIKFKSLLGCQDTTIIQDKHIEVELVTSLMLSYLKTTAEDYIKKKKLYSKRTYLFQYAEKLMGQF